MSVMGYCFTIEGASHTEKKLPCQDSSGILIKGAWRLAIVADGVGSCKHSDAASKLAVETASKVVNAAFPYEGDEDFLALIRVAMHSAENAIETYVVKNNGELQDYQTTLAMALFNGTTVYYGNAGDSGIVALDEFGAYHILSSKQNNEYGDVHTLAERKFEVGKADFRAAAVFCMTDGLLDWVVPKSLAKHTYTVHVPRASLFVPPSIWKAKAPIEEHQLHEYRDLVEGEIKKIVGSLLNGDTQDENYGDLTEGNLKDDLSAAVLINNESLIDPNSVAWAPLAEPTTDELYLAEWRNIKIMYPSVAKKKFIEYITKCNPKWSEDNVFEYAEKIWKLDSAQRNEGALDTHPEPKKKNKKGKPTPQIQGAAEWTLPNNARVESMDSTATDASSVPKRKGLWGAVAGIFGAKTDDSDISDNPNGD